MVVFQPWLLRFSYHCTYGYETYKHYKFLSCLAKTKLTIMIYFDANKLVANLTNRRKILLKVSNIFTLEKLLKDIGANCHFESKVICYFYGIDKKN